MNTTALTLLLICGHELPDGVITCGVQVIVRDERIELRYQIGLSPDTARQTLSQWGVELPQSEQVFPVFREEALKRCGPRFSIELDGCLQPPPRPVSVKEVRRAHARVECLYEIDNPTGDGRDHYLVIRDDNFPTMPGVREVAVKWRGGNEVRTSAPTVLGRGVDHDTAPAPHGDPNHDPNPDTKQVGPRQVRFWVGATGDAPPAGIWPYLIAIGLLIAVAGGAARYANANASTG